MTAPVEPTAEQPTRRRSLTRSQRAAQKLLDYCADGRAWTSKPSEHVIEALRILTGKPVEVSDVRA